MKTLDVVHTAIHDTKLPFRQVNDRSEKPKQHRYERRKIKEFIRQSDWTAEEGG
jgi:hypothetical protein